MVVEKPHHFYYTSSSLVSVGGSVPPSIPYVTITGRLGTEEMSVIVEIEQDQGQR
ncbi:hypothetical protein IMY05_012G0055400 [Salix suchowensis]|nr:hypothetical protein IMY05_012G0055400 [Salix suchowensis]